MEVVARYGYGYGHGEADVAWKVGRIMLKYRPIAPKPATGGTVAATDPVELRGTGRGKRKGCSKSKDINACKRGRKSGKKTLGVVSEQKNKINKITPCSPVVITLPLMPMTPERKEEEEEEFAPTTPSPTGSDAHVAALISYFGTPSWKRMGSTTNSPTGAVAVVAPRPVRPVGSYVTVECVTDKWQESQIPADLNKDTCPVFVSDAYGERVTWTNAAYRRMVVGPEPDANCEGQEKEEEEEEEEVKVALVTRGLVPDPSKVRVTCFTCRVRVRYACRRRGKVSVAVPCDVWRMEKGGLAWRLDVKAALSLSLGS